MIKYIGSKRVLVPRIVAAVDALPDVRSCLDLFSGTSRVGHGLKGRGYRVHANDHLTFAYTLARCYVEADRRRWLGPAERLLRELSRAGPIDGYVTDVFCRQARYFHPRNGRRIDGIRDEIERLDVEPPLKAIALTALMEAADRVDSTTGLQMAYLKQWAPRAHNDLELRMPEILPGSASASQMEAREAAGRFRADVAYLDPPYNQHSYMGNYHVWETLVRWDAPEHYGIACKRIDCREYRSPFNRKREAKDAMRSVLEPLVVRFVIVSFNNEGYLDRADLESMLQARGWYVRCAPVDHKRYVGAQIGIHDLQGRKVGRVSHLRNKELLFIAGEDAEAIDEAYDAVLAPDRQKQLALV